MAVETPADLASFFAPGEHAVVGVYLRDGVPHPVTGYHLRPSDRVLDGEFGGIMSRIPVFVMPEASLPGGAVEGDLLTVSGLTRRVEVIEPDGTGLVHLSLVQA